MSLSALKKAFYERAAGVEVLSGDALAAQDALAVLLAEDTETSLPAVHQGNKSVIVAYPALCFRESGGAPDTRWSADVGGIREVIFDVEIWSDSAAGNVISNIHDLVDKLFNTRRSLNSHGVRAPLPTLDSGRLKDMTALTDLSTLYDRDTNAWYGFCRYRFILAHY